MDCPNCGATMRERERSGVKIDFCPSCKGVWLDRGELDKIIAIELDEDGDFGGGTAVEARSVQQARPERRRDDDDDDDDDDRRYRAEGRRYRDDDEYRYGKKKSKKSTFFESLTDMFGGEAE